MKRSVEGAMRLRILLIWLVFLASARQVWAQKEVMFVISGEVRLEDGTAPPDAAQINRVCNGRTIPEAKTDSLGHFTFSVSGGESSSATADAGAPPAPASDLNKALNQTSTQYTNPITTALRDCEVQAVLSGFRPASVALAVHDTSDSGRVGTIILHPLSRSGSLTVSATTAAAPSSAKKAFDKGMALVTKERWEAAESEFMKAVTIYPKYAIAWYALGQVRQKRNAQSGAVEAWTQALQQDPKYIKPYESLASWADKAGNWTAAERYSRELIALDPDEFAAAYLINAVANARLNRDADAEESARHGLRIDKDRKVPRLDYVLGLLLLQKKEYAESMKYLQIYLELSPGAHDAATVREQVSKLQQMLAQNGHQQ